MSSWERIERLNQEAQLRIKEIYEYHGIPWEVRKFLSGWIETARENLLVCSEEQYSGLMNSFTGELGPLALSLEQPGRSQEEIQAAAILWKVFSLTMLENQKEFLYKLRNCIAEENRIFSEISNARIQIHGQGQNVSNHMPFNGNFEELTNVASTLVLLNQDAPITLTQSDDTTFSDRMSKLMEYQEELHGNRMDVDTESGLLLTNQLTEKLDHIVPTFINEFLYKLKWSELPRFWVDTEPMESSRREEGSGTVEQISKWFLQLVRTIEMLMMRTQFISPENQIKLQTWKTDMLRNGLYVVEQPSQTIKKGSRLEVKVRFLQEEGAAGSEKNYSPSNIYMLNENQARELHQTKTLSLASYLHLHSNEDILGEDQSKREDKKNEKKRQRIKKEKKKPVKMNVTKADEEKTQRANKNKNKPAMMTEEDLTPSSVLWNKWILLFVTTTKICGTNEPVWCCSVPFVFMSNTSQTCMASLTIFWYNYFRHEGHDSSTPLRPFQVPDTVPWCTFARAFKHYFQLATSTTWKLTTANLDYIGLKIFGVPGPHTNRRVSWRSISSCREDEIVSVWTWLFHIVKLVKSQADIPWESGAVVGFIDRPDAEEIVERKRRAVIIRFSDSVLGAITVTSNAPSNGSSSAEPMNNAKLNTLPLHKFLMDLSYCDRVLFFDENGNKRFKGKAEMFPVRQTDEKALPAAQSVPINGKIRKPYETIKTTTYVDSLAFDFDLLPELFNLQTQPAVVTKDLTPGQVQESAQGSWDNSTSSSSNPFESDNCPTSSDWTGGLDATGNFIDHMEGADSMAAYITDDVDMENCYLPPDPEYLQQYQFSLNN